MSLSIESSCASAGLPARIHDLDVLRRIRQLRLDFHHIGSRPRLRIEQHDRNAVALRIHVRSDFAKRSQA